VDPGNQLPRIERLRQVVVGPQLEADDSIHVLTARGEHQDRKCALAAKPAENIETGDHGEHHIEHEDIERLCKRPIESGRTVIRAIDREALTLQVRDEEFAKLPIVIYDEDATRPGD
jgi:hypothetical protein